MNPLARGAALATLPMLTMLTTLSGPAGAAPPRTALERLQAYVRLDTSNPPGNEKAAALFLKSLLDEAGIASEMHEPAPGRASLCARLRGDGKEPALVLHHHIDVVPADGARWSSPPFAGEVKSLRLVGRGTLDDKSLGIAELEAFLSLAKGGKKRNRDVIFLATADEETGGALGVASILKAKPSWLAGAGFAIGEGGISETVVDEARFFGVETAEKGALWIRLTVRGAGGPASSVTAESAGNRLARALGRIASWERPPRLVPDVASSLARQAPLRPQPQRTLLARLERFAAEDPKRIVKELPPRDLNLLLDTIAVTRIGSDSPATNALPARAWAELDARLLPGTDPDRFLAELKTRLGDDGIGVETLLRAASRASSPAGGLYDAISRTFGERFPRAVVAPSVAAVLTENRVLREAGLVTYGLFPFRSSVFDQMGIHGENERIRPDWFEEGVETLRRIVARFVNE